MNRITTRRDLLPDGLPLQEYPRPQLQRNNWQCLNGYYDYAITTAGEEPTEYDGKILVPFSPESALSGVGKPLLPDQWLWYRRTFTVENREGTTQTLLNFGAVDWECKVYINGSEAGGHTGGYCPFSINITPYLTEGENELRVRVYDPTDSGHQQRGKQVLEPHGFWYTATSGIWQTVWLENVNNIHINSIKLLPDIDSEKINVKVALDGGRAYTLRATVSDGGEKIFDGEIGLNSDIIISDPKLWSPENPFLYDLEIRVFSEGESVDTVKSYFGMRKFSIAKDKDGNPRLCLNNKPYFQCGLLDQGYWCDSQLTPPSDKAMIYDIETMKRLGFNMLRKHIKAEPLRWYYHCDRLGMLVWQDMMSGGEYIGTVLAGVLPNVGINVKDDKYKSFKRGEKAWREEFEHELFELIGTLYNCVSISCWVPFNEGWGQFDARRIADAVKKYDGSRIVDHASGWHDQKGADLKSVHKYILPVRLPKPDGRPFVLSEYGGYSQIIPNHVWDEKNSFGYKMYKSKDKLTAAYKSLIEKQILPLVSEGLCATVYTQVSDVELEVNGIMSYDREQIKLDESTVLELNNRLTAMNS